MVTGTLPEGSSDPMAALQLRGACAAFARACGPLQPVPAQLVELFHILFQVPVPCS